MTRLAIVQEIIDAFEHHLGGEHPAYQFRGVLTRIKHREETGDASAVAEASEPGEPATDPAAVETKSGTEPTKNEKPAKKAAKK